jgi:hypothetical protein
LNDCIDPVFYTGFAFVVREKKLQEPISSEAPSSPTTKAEVENSNIEHPTSNIEL